VLGRYGYGYATIHDPAFDHGPLLWGRPFQPGFESFVFEVRNTGETVVTSPSPSIAGSHFRRQPRPGRDGLQIADLFSFGLASRLLPGLQNGFDPLLTPVARDQCRNRRPGKPLPWPFSRQRGAVFSGAALYVCIPVAHCAVQTYCQIPDWRAPRPTCPLGFAKDKFGPSVSLGESAGWEGDALVMSR